MQQKIAFIGAGHITEILINRFIKNGSCSGESILISDPDGTRTSELRQKFGVSRAEDNISAIKSSDIIFICVQPQIIPLILDDLKSACLAPQIIISVSAGIPLSLYEGLIENVKAVRILPNPPSRIGEGAVPVAMTSTITPEEKTSVILPLIRALGPCFNVSDDKIDIFTSVTSPAPVLTFFESMIDSAVLCGLDQTTSAAMVFQTVKGCLKMWEETPDIKYLIDQACTPAGTSVESLRIMDKMGFRSAVKESYYAAWQKSKGFGEDKK